MPLTYFTCANCGRAAVLAEFEVRCPYCRSLSGTYSSEPPADFAGVRATQRSSDDAKQSPDSEG